jgi:rubrerythrin
MTTLNDASRTAAPLPSAAPSRRDSRSWWAAVKQDPAAFRRWLLKQYRGEATAAARIEQLRDMYASEPAHRRAHRILTVIASQERRHASWIADLLRAHGIEPVVQGQDERYWAHTLPGIDNLTTGCAVGAHAERMRLERIEAIASDPAAPADVRATFARILREERFHERAFRELAGPGAMEATRQAHSLGRTALGLEP